MPTVQLLENSLLTRTNGVTPVVIVPSPVAPARRTVTSVVIYNGDAATTHIVYIARRKLGAVNVVFAQSLVAGAIATHDVNHYLDEESDLIVYLDALSVAGESQVTANYIDRFVG